MKKIVVALSALCSSASALAMPAQVPDRYYEHRAFLVDVWIDHVPCSPQVLWTCNLARLS